MNRLVDTSDTTHQAARERRSVLRVFALLSIPFALFTAGVLYLVWFSDLGHALRGVAADERATVVRYAIEHTPPAEVPHLLAAVGRGPEAWDRRVVTAVLSLVERAQWPVPALPDVVTAELLAEPPTAWSSAEVASVDELLQRFRSFHTARRTARSSP